MVTVIPASIDKRGMSAVGRTIQTDKKKAQTVSTGWAKRYCPDYRNPLLNRQLTDRVEAELRSGKRTRGAIKSQLT